VALTKGEIEIGAADRVGARRGIARGPRGGLDRLGETVECSGSNGGEDVILVAELAIGCHGADAHLPGDLAHGHRFRPALGEQPLGDLAEPAAKGGDLGIGKVSGHIFTV
jgi:hypothetical protein